MGEERVAATEAVSADTTLSVLCRNKSVMRPNGECSVCDVREQHGVSDGHSLPAPQVGISALTSVAAITASAAVLNRRAIALMDID